MVNSAKERLSVATSNSSNINSELGPAPSLISPQNPAKFQRVPTEILQGFLCSETRWQVTPQVPENRSRWRPYKLS